MLRMSPAALAALGCLVSSAVAQEPEPAIARIGFVIDRAGDRSDRLREMVQQELVALAGSNFVIEFPAAYDIVADGTVEDVTAAVADLASNEAIDVLVALDFLGSQVAGIGAPWPRPVVAGRVVDARLQGLPLDAGTSGVADFTYVTVPAPITRDLQMLQEIAPTQTVDLLLSPEALDGFGEFIDRLREEAASVGITLRFIGATTAARTLAQIPDDAEAVYLLPLDQMPRGEFQALVDGINERRLPSFAFEGRAVEAGVLASLSPGDEPRLARRIAINVHRILLGDDPSTFSVNFTPGEELVLNMRTVRQTGVIPPLGLILEARRLFESREGITREVTLQSAMQEAIRANISLAIQDEFVASGRQEVRLATSDLLPSMATKM